jgi:hypothetical protein
VEIMGEYAKVIKTGEQIKIGTCYSMYYMTHAQKELVNYKFNEKFSYRLFFKDEEKVKIGYYDNFNRGIPILNSNKFFTDEQIENMEAGLILISGNGIVANIPCYHNLKLEKDTGKINLRFIGKREAFEVKRIAETKEGYLTFIIECTLCRESFILDLQKIDLLETYFENNEDLQMNINYVKNYNNNVKNKLTN